MAKKLLCPLVTFFLAMQGFDAFSATYNVKDYGVKGDGRTDDSKAIQSVLRKAVGATDQTIVEFPDGVYRISGNPLSIYSNTTLKLSSGATIRFAPNNNNLFGLLRGQHTLANGSDCPMSSNESCKSHGGYSQIQNVVVDGGVWDVSGYGSNIRTYVMRFVHGNNITIKNLTCKGAADHYINLSGTANARVENVIFTKPEEFTGTDSADAYGVDVVEAVHMDFITESGENVSYPVDGTPSKNITIAGCTFDGTFAGVGTHPHTDSGDTGSSAKIVNFADNIVVSNNTFVGLRTYAFSAYCFKNSVFCDNTVNDNMAENPLAVGVRVVGESDVRITGNAFYGMGSQGVIATPFEGDNLKVVIEDNIISNALYNAIRMDRGSAVEGTASIEATVKGNTIYSPGNYGLSLNGLGVNISCRAERNLIRNPRQHGMAVSAGAVLTAIDNTIDAAGESGFALNASGDCVIIGNVILNPARHGILASNEATCTLSDNTIENSGEHGVWISTGSTGTITDNSILDSAGYGIGLSGAGACFVKGNEILGARSDVAAVYVSATSDVEISENVITDVVGMGVRVVGNDNGIVKNVKVAYNNINADGAFDVMVNGYCKECQVVGNILRAGGYRSVATDTVYLPGDALILSAEYNDDDKTSATVKWEFPAYASETILECATSLEGFDNSITYTKRFSDTETTEWSFSDDALPPTVGEHYVRVRTVEVLGDGIALESVGAAIFTVKISKRTADWRIVSFDANGGSVSEVSRRVAAGSKIGTLPVPSRSGYAFGGWWTSAAGGRAVTEDTMVSADMTVYAHWGSNSYTLTVDPNGGLLSGAVFKTADGTAGPARLTVQYWATDNNKIGTAKKAGYFFNGWFTAKSGGKMVFDANGQCVAGSYWNSNKQWKYTGNLTVYAQWTLKKVTITVYPNGSGGVLNGNAFGDANGKSMTAKVSVTYGSTAYNKLGGAIRSGYVFMGWFTERTGGVQVFDNTGKGVLGDYWDDESRWCYDGNALSLNLYAQWVKNAFTLSCNPRGGVLNSSAFGDSNGQNKIGKVTLTYGSSAYHRLGTAKKSGYVFTGWWTAIDGGEQVFDKTGTAIPGTSYWSDDSTWQCAKDITVYAQWAKVSYTVKFNPNGGTLAVWNDFGAASGKSNTRAKLTVKYGTTIYSTVARATKDEYAFMGWYSDRTAGEQIYNASGKAVAGSSCWDDDGKWRLRRDIELFARWEKVSYTVTYNPNGGTLAVWSDFGAASGRSDTRAKLTVKYGTTIYSTVARATKDKYTFMGWYSDRTAGEQIYNASGKAVVGSSCWDSDGKWCLRSDIELFARWSIASGAPFVVTVYPNGGALKGSNFGNSDGLAKTAKVTMKYNSTAYSTLGTGTKYGYTFTGWFTARTGGVKVFDANGRAVNGTAYWTADGKWCYAKDISLYAQWALGKYKLVVNPNGGLLSGGGFKTANGTAGPAELQVIYTGKSYNKIGVAVRTGYTFDGWFTSASGGDKVFDASGQCVTGDYWNSDKQWMFGGNLTVYAHWTVKKYTLTFDPNGGTLNNAGSFKDLSGPTSEPQTRTVTYNGASYNKVSASISRAGYAFAGWVASDGTVVYDATGQCLTSRYWNADLRWIYDGDLVLRAMWTAKTYTVTFNPGEGTLATDGFEGASVSSGGVALQVTYGSGSFNSVGVAVRTGYTFNGWFTGRSDGDKVYDAAGQFVAGCCWSEDGRWAYAGNRSLYAQWTAKRYTLTFDPNGGTITGGSFGNASDVATPLTLTVTYNGASYNKVSATMKRTGYSFAGWCDAAGTLVYDSTGQCVESAYWDSTPRWVHDGGLDLYAQWTPKTYTLIFNPNGGLLKGAGFGEQDGTGGSSYKLSVEYGKAIDCAPGIAEKTGKAFLGWFDNRPDGIKVFDKNGSIVAGSVSWIGADGSWLGAASYTVYALWGDLSAAAAPVAVFAECAPATEGFTAEGVVYLPGGDTVDVCVCMIDDGRVIADIGGEVCSGIDEGESLRFSCSLGTVEISVSGDEVVGFVL